MAVPVGSLTVMDAEPVPRTSSGTVPLAAPAHDRHRIGRRSENRRIARGEEEFLRSRGQQVCLAPGGIGVVRGEVVGVSRIYEERGRIVRAGRQNPEAGPGDDDRQRVGEVARG